MVQKSVNLITSACLFACALFAVTSCKDSDDFLTKDGKGTAEETSYFDFSTKRTVDLVVDYSVRETLGPVRFAVYYKNPIVNEGVEGQYIDDSIEPLYVDYTDKDGKYDQTITLPAYAKVLHIVTSDFTIGLNRMVVEVENGEAKAVLEVDNDGGTTRAAGKTGPGPATTEFKNFANLSFKVNSSGVSTSTRVYKDWNILLGSWDEYSGRPNYLLDPATASSDLFIPEEELDGLYDLVKNTFNSAGTNNSSIKDDLRKATDLTLIRDAEVSITILGSMTCWTNTMGYYYYTEDNKPTKPMDLNIIMLFPNTQDGLRYTTNPDNASNQGNIGTKRGDTVQLMYYPNIEKGSTEGATKIFPKGTRIGFILKAHGWGTQSSGTEYCIKNGSTIMDKKMNIWGASTDGISYESGGKIKNPNGEARTAKFDYVSPKGTRYAITSFEDGCDDTDYDDLFFALTPANAFVENAEVANGKSSKTGVFAFEDMWPNQGDYDMNDVVVNCRNEVEFNTSGKVTKQNFYLTTYQKNVDLINGLAVRFASNCPATSKVVMKKMAPGVTDLSQAVSANYNKFVDTDGSTIYYLTNRVEDDLGSTYIFELTYKSAQNSSDLDEIIEPFIYRDEDDGRCWEVHIPDVKPTSKMNTDYYGQKDDRTNPSKGQYFVREGLYPFAFHLWGTKAEHFFETILSQGGDLRPIDHFYPTFRPWSSSRGKEYSDWYLNPR